MQATVIINLVDVYEIWSRLWSISNNIHQGEVLPNLVLSLPKSIQVPVIKSRHRCLLQAMVWDSHLVL